MQRTIGLIAVTAISAAGLTAGGILAATRDDDSGSDFAGVAEAVFEDGDTHSLDEIEDATTSDLEAWWWQAPSGSTEETRIEHELADRGHWLGE
jgi:hypothetical protein